jgi:methionine-rich copper-binding protein CopC
MSANVPQGASGCEVYDLGQPAEDPSILWLEPSLLAITGDGATHSIEPGGSVNQPFQQVESIRLVFDQPLDGMFVDGSIDLYLLDPELGDSPVSVLTEWDAADPNAVWIRLDGPLSPGLYRADVSMLASLMSVDGLMAEPGRTVGLFTVAEPDWSAPNAPGPRFSHAIDLGLMGPAGLSVIDSLDLDTDPAALRLYRFELPTGTADYRFGAELETSIGPASPHALITLFDASGNPLKTAQTGLPQSPEDPFLFARLGAGVYYIAVAGTGNTPDRAGAYDLVQGVPATGLTSQTGGLFRLSLAAVDAGSTARVLDATLRFADPLDPSPTAIELTFSQAMMPSAEAWPVLTVVDAQGRAVAAVPSQYDSAQARITFTLESRLTPGHYTLSNTPDGGLVDLAGRAPVADGLPSGVLAQFDVADRTLSRAENDFGTLYPSTDRSPLKIVSSLTGGETRTYRFVMSESRFVSLNYRSTAAVLVELAQPSGTSVDLRQVDSSAVGLVRLDPGVYLIRITALTASGADAQIAIHLSESLFESIALNGIGQGSVLPLLAVTPRVHLTAPVTVATQPGSGAVAVIATGPAAPGVEWNAPSTLVGLLSDVGGSNVTSWSAPGLPSSGVTASVPWSSQPAGMPTALAQTLAPASAASGTVGTLQAQSIAAILPGEAARVAAVAGSIALGVPALDIETKPAEADTPPVKAALVAVPSGEVYSPLPDVPSIRGRLAWLLGGMEERALAMLADRMNPAEPSVASTPDESAAITQAEQALVDATGLPEAERSPMEARIRPAVPAVLLSLAVLLGRGQAFTFLDRWRRGRPASLRLPRESS